MGTSIASKTGNKHLEKLNIDRFQQDSACCSVCGFTCYFDPKLRSLKARLWRSQRHPQRHLRLFVGFNQNCLDIIHG
ncbi:MAG: hypothetical protein ACBR12_09945 [Microcoleus sp.]